MATSSKLPLYSRGLQTIDPFTGSKGYQGETFEERLAGPRTIDPFDDGVEPIVAATPTAQPVAVASGLGPRARPIMRNDAGGLIPVAAPADMAAERAKRTIPIPLYNGEDVRVSTQRMSGAPEPQRFDPATQEMLDSARDYLNNWTTRVRDEAGNERRVLRASPTDETPVSLQREIDQLERDDLQRAIEAEAQRRATMPVRRMI